MRLSKLATAVNSAIEDNHALLVYGPPKVGKTEFVGTAAKIPEIQNIYWFDLENGWQTLKHMGLTEEEMNKIVLFRIPDTRENPVGIETMLKLFSAKSPLEICELHGKVSCAECRKNKADVQNFWLPMAGHYDLVVIDSGSQLGDSALNAASIGQPPEYKLLIDDYGNAGRWLSDILSVIQQAKNTNFVVITHELVDTDEINGVKRDRIYPLVGTRAFCRKVAKYFGTIAYLHMKMGKHAAGSSTTYKTDTLTGSRVHAKLEASSKPSMRDILIEGGVLKAPSTEASPAPTAAPAEEKPAVNKLLARTSLKR